MAFVNGKLPLQQLQEDRSDAQGSRTLLSLLHSGRLQLHAKMNQFKDQVSEGIVFVLVFGIKLSFHPSKELRYLFGFLIAKFKDMGA